MEHCFLWEIPDKFTLINREVSIEFKDKLTTNREGEKAPQTARDIIEVPSINESNKITKTYQEQEFILDTFYTIMERAGYDDISENERVMKLLSSIFHQVLQTSKKESFNKTVEDTKAFNWEIPDKFYILDTEYSVIREEDKLHLKGELGEINNMAEIVTLQPCGDYNNFTENSIKRSYLHEVIHGTLFPTGEYELTQDETLIDLLAGCWNQIFNTGIIERK